MAKPEVRMSEGTAAFLVLAVIAVLVGAFTNWYGFGPETVSPDVPQVNDGQVIPLQLIPAIEKTKLYVSTFDQADFTDEAQNNRVNGTMALIKSGVNIDTVTTVTTGAAASTSEFNGGDKVIGLGDASSYYAKATGSNSISETLQPISVFIKAAAAADVYVEDEKQDTITTLNISANEVTKVHSIVIERPGDDAYYQFCGIALDYNDEEIVPQIKQAGSFVDGLKVLEPLYDVQDAAGNEAVWAFDQTIRNFDTIKVDLIVGTKKDVTPSSQNLTITVFDCEENLQSGEVVYTSEDSADSDVGLANIESIVAVN